MSLSKVIETARAELGVKESPPGSNRVKYWDDYDKSFQGQPWCVAFLWWVFNTAGERMAFFGGGQTASCSILLRWYREQEMTVDKQNVQAGDIVLMNFSGTVEPQHCGLVTRVERSGGSILYIKTIEGNTTSGDTSQDNGGMVCEKVRYPRQVVGVCRPQYQPEQEAKDDVSGHWFTSAVEWAREKGLIKNYPDGSFKPNNPLTRAEACAMFERFYQLLWEDDMR